MANHFLFFLITSNSISYFAYVINVFIYIENFPMLIQFNFQE